MATDDPGQNDPFTPFPHLGGEHPQDELVSLPQGHEPEVDAWVPVQDRVRGRTNPAVIVFLISAVAPALLAIVQVITRAVPHWLVSIGGITASLPVIAVGFGGVWHDKLVARDRSILFWAGGIGLVAVCVLFGTIGIVPFE